MERGTHGWLSRAPSCAMVISAADIKEHIRPVHWLANKRFGETCRVAFFLLILLSVWVERTNADSFEEATIKAAFVLNFAKFTTWPADAFAGPDADIELWVMGDATVQRAFASIDGETVGSRKIHVRYGSLVSSGDPCHMLFAARDVQRSILTEFLAIIHDRPVLSVGEMTDFIRLGGIINIFSKDGRFCFEIKPTAADRRGLQISSRLLKLAIVID